ncbi:MAG: HPF/RaiA family ribosome-associated protein [Rhodothermales bacterium]
MGITIQTVGMRLTENLRTYATEKIEDTLRFFGKTNPETIRIDLLLSRHEEKGQIFRAKANITVPGDHFFLEEEADDINVAVSRLKQSITKRARRWRERLMDRHQKTTT